MAERGRLRDQADQARLLGVQLVGSLGLGSLAQGLSVAIGYTLADRLKGSDARTLVFAVMASWPRLHQVETR